MKTRQWLAAILAAFLVVSVASVAAAAVLVDDRGGQNYSPIDGYAYTGQQAVNFNGQTYWVPVYQQVNSDGTLNTSSGTAVASADSALGQALIAAGWQNDNGQVYLRSGAPSGATVSYQGTSGSDWRDVPSWVQSGYQGGGVISIQAPTPTQTQTPTETTSQAPTDTTSQTTTQTTTQTTSQTTTSTTTPTSTPTQTPTTTETTTDTPPQPPPCYPSPDARRLTATVSPNVVHVPGGTVTVQASVTGTAQQVQATTSWGETQDMKQGQDGAWYATFLVPSGLKGTGSVTVSAVLSQGNGCGGTYGPNGFTHTPPAFTIIGSTSQQDQQGDGQQLLPAHLPFEDYIQVCLGTAEPIWCGLDVYSALGYAAKMRDAWLLYARQMGYAKYVKLVNRIDQTLVANGLQPSGLPKDIDPGVLGPSLP